MTLPAIETEDTGRTRHYRMVFPEGTAALRITFAAPGTVIADHTGVPRALEGRGIARVLLDALIADARREGWRISPACSYVDAQRRRHPEWADLFAT